MRASSIGLLLRGFHPSAAGTAWQVIARASGSGSKGGTVGVPSDSLDAAFLDARARELLEGARERQLLIDPSVQAYETTAAERISLRMRAVRRDRSIWGREVVARVAWRREGPVAIDFIGARVPPISTLGFEAA